MPVGGRGLREVKDEDQCWIHLQYQSCKTQFVSLVPTHLFYFLLKVNYSFKFCLLCMKVESISSELFRSRSVSAA